jgi:cytochrome c peroxidase
MGFASSFMFDGAALSLEEQALLPLLNPHEMDMTAAEVERRLTNDTMYVRLFQGAFGSGPITIRRVALALATYQRTLVSDRAPYDRWAAGDSTALSESARRGAALFLGEKGGCVRCHIPPLFTDGKFHDIGLDSLPADSGRARVTKNELDFGKFKTPTLRNILHTGPYMHDGRLVSLEHVVMHYNTGIKASGRVDGGLKLLGLEEDEIFDLVAFLESLTDDFILHSAQP